MSWVDARMDRRRMEFVLFHRAAGQYINLAAKEVFGLLVKIEKVPADVNGANVTSRSTSLPG